MKKKSICAVIALLCTLLLTFQFVCKNDEKKFSELSRQLFTEEMTSNTLNMHYTLADPESFGISFYEPLLPRYNADTQGAAAESIEETLTLLHAINPAHLSDEDAYTYKLLARLLENSAQLKSYPYYPEPLSPSSGIQSQLPILLAEYTFRNRRDVEDYLALLDQTDDYFASLLSYEQEKYAAGLSMSSYSFRQVLDQCDTIVTKEALSEGNHFLQTTFEDRLESLCEENIITNKEKEKYIAQNNRLLRTVLQPAYEKLADGIFILKDAEGVPALPSGLAALPDGREYYRYLLISETGSYRPIEDIQRLLADTLGTEYTTIKSAVKKNPRLPSALAAENYCVLPFRDADAMLQDLRLRMAKDFPALDKDPAYSVKTVSNALEDYCAPAFYLTAPLDDTDNNAIYINRKNAPSDLDLYTTLAHEGYPGHLYQTVYNNQRFMDQRAMNQKLLNQRSLNRRSISSGGNEMRQLLWYGGYLEGWALYVEFYGYDYATNLLLEQGRREDAVCVQLEKHNRSLLLCLYSMLDIMIHYQNTSREEAAQLLGQFGIRDAAANAIYSYIADAPCNYLKYYLGYLEILELKKTAKEKWKGAYSDYAFHTFLLNAGPSDFPALEELLSDAAPASP